MNELFKSASKLVLLYVVLILGALTAFAGVWGIIKGTLDPKEIITLYAATVTFVLGYFFTHKGDPQLPYGGK